MSVTTAKTVENMLGQFIETTDAQDSMLGLVKLETPDAKKMQNSSNFYWENVQQRRPTISGWDMSGEAGGIIQETYPKLLGTPENDVITVRIDDARDDSYLMNAVKEGAVQQNTKLNTELASAISVQGSMFIRDNSTNGFDFLGECQAMMDERQGKVTERTAILNTRNSLTFASDLAARQNVVGRPENAWSSGVLANDVCGFKNVLTGSFLPSIVGDADASRVVGATAPSYAPRGGTVDATTGICTNYDYRKAVLTTVANTGFIVGDKITIADVYSVGLSDKQSSGELMTFTVLDVDSGGTDMTISPRPIAPASSDTSLTTVEGAYSNVDSQIAAGAAITRLNIDTTDPKVNLFFEKSAIEVIGGIIPAEKFKTFGGNDCIHGTLKNGLEAYMLYTSDIMAATLSYRLFVWYGITITNPSICGSAVKY